MRIIQNQDKSRFSSQFLKKVGSFSQHAASIDMRNFWLESGDFLGLQHIQHLIKPGRSYLMQAVN